MNDQRKYLKKYDLTREESLLRARVSGRKRKTEYTYLIEGEYLNLTQMGERLGVSRQIASLRHRACSVPVTWEKLQCHHLSPAP